VDAAHQVPQPHLAHQPHLHQPHQQWTSGCAKGL
jgi:hypothetical protein